VHLQGRSITASQCISQLHDLGIQMHLQTRSITASMCISEFNLILASKCISELLDLGLQTRSITACKCISEFNWNPASKYISKLTRSQPPSTFPSSHDHGLQVHLEILSISISSCSCDYAPVSSAASLAICIYKET